MDKGELRSRGSASTKAGWDRAGGAGVPPGVHTVRFQLRYGRGYLIGTNGALVVVVGLLRTRPPVRLMARNGGADVCRCNGLRIYHHLPLIYQFSNDWVFAFEMNAGNCWLFVEKRD